MPEQEALQSLIERHTREIYPRRAKMNAWLRRSIPALRFERKEYRFFRSYAEGLLRREQIEARSQHPEARPAPLTASFELAGQEFYELLQGSGPAARCDWCRGTGRCPFCDGRGANPRRYAKTIATEPCQPCSETGLCEHCHGNKTQSYQQGRRIKFVARKLGPHDTAPEFLRERLPWRPAQDLPTDPYRGLSEPTFQSNLERLVEELKNKDGALLTRTFLEEGRASRVRYQWRGPREFWLFGLNNERVLFVTPPCPRLF